MQDVIYAIKVAVFVFIAMVVISACITLAERKENRLPWKRVFEITIRTYLAILVASIVIFGLGAWLLKP